ncbi:MAG TPA: cobaltochelatase subunit CobN [Acetobacteraceae bacterium]|nr:cobaltochelatase subunit CobN [Acetobacteraceae bacterium]
MHLLVRETRTLDEEEGAVDLGHDPAELVFLSFADSDLGAAASGWLAMGAARPSLRLASLAKLRHPMSVDLYAERVIVHARSVVIRLLGGLDYWRYGAEEFASLCRAQGISLALLPGDAREDPRLTELSTVPPEALAALHAYMREGGPRNLCQALLLAAQLGGIGQGPTAPPEAVPCAGEYALSVPAEGVLGSAAIIFYRSHLLSGDIAPIDALARTLQARGLGARAIHVSGLKDEAAAAFVASRLREWRPAVVLNATGFSARQGEAGSPLDGAGVPVLQLVLSGAPRAAWQASLRGLSQTDLAMQVVLPELDGRLLTAAIGFKNDAEPVRGLDFVRKLFRPDAEGLALAADEAAGWASLATIPRAERRIAILLSDYPAAIGGGQVGYAVGLDSLASLGAIARLLQGAGYDVDNPETLSRRLLHTDPEAILTLGEYRHLFAKLPKAVRERVFAAWGDPSEDPALRDGSFALAYVTDGKFSAAVQPDRGSRLDRKTSYHDPDLPPCHSYLACYLWLRERCGIHALIPLGTHGTLEWLPGKTAALSAACFPAVLAGGLPVIYPFIVNNPGEAAVAKRRLGAVTIGHLTPPLRPAGTYGDAAMLERLIEEFAAADGLDRRRTAMLRREILDLAAASGLLAESGGTLDAPEDEALARLDAYLCDLKMMQIRDGLHVFGQAPETDLRAGTVAALQAFCPGFPAGHLDSLLDRSASAEGEALLAALDGRFVAPGPAGAPTRGRPDVLPTGRNLFALDPRTIPTRSALALAERAAEDLLRRHRQDHGAWPRTLVIDLWGSTAMRTGGEDLALALVLLGARPIWDEGSARVTGIEIFPLAVLNRPRVDVTLRISGLFRDAFEAQVLLFDSAVRTIAAQDEDETWNPLAGAARGLEGRDLRQATARVFGPAPGAHGTGLVELLTRGVWQKREELGAAYIAGSAHAYGRMLDGVADAPAFAARVAAADGFIHVQDHGETDLLESLDPVAHEGGFAAAAHPGAALYHLDTARPDAPRTRTLIEEVRRVVRGRAANPDWIAGMMRHGYRGAADIARSLDALHGFAATLPERLDRQFDMMFDATLGDPAVDSFLRSVNPAARAAMAARFEEAICRGLWHPRRNTGANRLRGDEK